jgi:hypothetical protein
MILQELTTLLTPILPIETGVFSEVPPDEYIVLTPMADVFEVHADNRPQSETQEVRISLFSKGNYNQRRQQIVKALLSSDFTITGRRYIGYENDSGYHAYGIDVSKNYELED